MTTGVVPDRATPAEIAAAFVSTVERLFAAGGGWVSRDRLRVEGWSDRMIRAGRQHAAGRVIFSTDPGGFKPTVAADENEVARCRDDLRHRAEVMLLEAREIERVWMTRPKHENQRELF